MQRKRFGLTLAFFWLPLALIAVMAILVNCESKSSNNSQLPEFHLRYFTDDLHLGDYTDVEVSYFNKNGDLEFESKEEVKYRGNSSFQYEKKSYSIKFASTKCFGASECNPKWKLNAEYIDKTLMRNKLSYDLFRSFSEGNFAPEIQFVEVYENTDYRGIYALNSGVDEHILNLEIADSGALLFKEPPISYAPEEHNDRKKKFEHYSKISIRYDDFSERARKKLIKESYYNQRFPNIEEEDKREEIHEITSFIFNSSNEEFSNQKLFEQYFNLDNLIDWHLLLMATNNGDGVMKNFYLYRQKNGEPFLFCPWDYDHSFGRDGDGEPSKQEFIDVSKMHLLNRLLETNAMNYRQKLYSKFLLLQKKDILTTEHLFEMIEANANELRPYIKKNEERWPVEHIEYFNNTDFEKEVSRMKSWISNNLSSMEVYLKDLQ